MENCNKCGAELSENEVELCSKCTSDDSPENVSGDDATENEDSAADSETTQSDTDTTESDTDAALSNTSTTEIDSDTSEHEPEGSDEFSDKAALVALTKKEKEKRLFITLAAGIVIVGLVVALIIVLVNPGNDDAPTIINGVETVDAAVILERLRSYDGDDFTTFFTEMMFEYSEDPGLINNPGGYLFREGIMVEEFYNAAAALEIGEMSDLVETIHGYHIIYRVPIDPNAIYPQTQHSLRMVYSIESFNAMAESWLDNLDYEFTDDYFSIDIVQMFNALPSPDIDEEVESEPEGETEADAADITEETTETEAEAEVEVEETTESETEAETGNQNGQNLGGLDLDNLFATFDPNTPMIVIGEHVIAWEELYSMIYFWVASLYESFGYIPDLSEPLGDDVQPLYEVIMELVEDDMIRRLARRHNAELLNIEFSEEDNRFLDESLDQMVAQHGGEEDFMTLLWEGLGIRNIELFRQILADDRLEYAIFEELYGAGGELFPDDELFRRAEEEGLIMAKHILIMHDQPIPDSP